MFGIGRRGLFRLRRGGAALLFLFLASIQGGARGDDGGEALAARSSVALSGAWEVAETRDGGESPPRAGWREISVPGTVYGGGQGGPQYAWFRRTFMVPEDWEGRRVFLRLAGAWWDARVYVDGRPMGRRTEGFSPFELELTGKVKLGRTQMLQIRCQDWSATFAKGFSLPEDVEGELRYAPVGQVLYPVGGHFYRFGLWDDVELFSRPLSHLAEPVISTSVREETLAVSGRVQGPGTGLWVQAEVMDGKRMVLEMRGREANGDGSWRLGEPFPGARPWSPEDPHLYRLKIILRAGRDGEILDILEMPCGFRELWAEGPDFYLNGVKRRLLATSTWPAQQPLSRAQVRQVLRQVKDGNNVAFRLHTQPWRKIWVEMADEVGVMIVMEGALWCDSGGAYAYGSDEFWRNYREHLRGMVERDRNNASLVMWSLENELLHCGCEKFDPDAEEKLADLGRFVKRLDPDRLIVYESDHDPGGVADVIGLHYPHELPEHSAYPDTADWLDREVETGKEGGLLGSRRAAFKWNREKPLYIGEYLWVPTGNGSPGTVFFGDLAHADNRGYDLKAKALAWRDQTVAYRRAGVSALCPWTEFESGAARFPLDLNPDENILYQAQKWAYRPVAAYLRERDSRFYAGEKVLRTFDVFNDGPQKELLKLSWRLIGGKQKGSLEMELAPGEKTAAKVEIRMPQVSARRRLVLEARLAAGRRKISRDSWDLEVWPIRAVAGPAGVGIALYDPAGAWGPNLGQAGLKARTILELGELAAADPARELLVIAPGALGKDGAETGITRVGDKAGGAVAALDFLARGGRILVMEQESLGGLPLDLELVEHASTMAFPLQNGHPVLAGLGEDALKFWSPGHYVARWQLRRPARGGAKALAVSGGPNGVGQGPILEKPVGKGLVLFMQVLTGEKLGSEPVAAELLVNALRYLAGYRLPPGRTAAVLQGEEFPKALRAISVEFDLVRHAPRRAELADVGLLIMHGGGEAVEGTIPHLRKFLEEGTPGRSVYWHAPDPGLFPRLAEDLGLAGLSVEPSAGPVSLSLPGHPAMAGVAREDLNFRGRARGPSWFERSDPDPSIIDSMVIFGQGVGEAVSLEVKSWRREEGVGLSADGRRLEFFRNGSVAGRVKVKRAGYHVVNVIADGTPVGGVYPTVSLRAGSRELAKVSLTESGVRSYPSLVLLPERENELTVSFINDSNEGGEDRNLFLEDLTISEIQWEEKGMDFLTLPPGIAGISYGKGQVVLDCVRWESNRRNTVKGRRYASVLLRNLGARFSSEEERIAWIPAGRFTPGEGDPRIMPSGGAISFFAWGKAQAEFECASAGRYRIHVRGRSTPAKGAYAKARLSLDGNDLGEVELAGETVASYSGMPVELSQGRHALGVEFSNDLNAPPEDRNLFISAVGFGEEK